MAKKKPESEKLEPRPQAKPQKSQRKDQPRLPLLLDFSLTVSKVCVGLVGGLVALLSILAGNPLWTAALRAGVGMAVTGAVLWVFNWFLMRRSLEIAVIEMAKRLDESSNSTISRRV